MTPNPSPREVDERRPRSRAILGLAGVIALLAACGQDARGVRGSGTIEMDEIDVASLVGGRVTLIRFEEGDTVRAGDTLAVLDRGELRADVRAQEAQTERAAAELRDLQAGPRPTEVQAARAALAAATAQAQLAEAELKRTAQLAERQVASPAELDRAKSARDDAVSRRAAAADQVRLLEQGFRRQQVQAAARAVDAARAQLAGSLSRAGELLITAPASGVVLLRNFDPGEIAVAGVPIVTLGNPDSLWMRVYIAAPKLPRVRLGAPVEVRVLGDSRAFQGRVIQIADQAEFTPRAALTQEERANLVFGVKVALTPTGGALKAGLPADAWIHVAAAPPP